ncbi:hypothetical protein CRJUMX01_1720003 [Escherichia coli]|nr:hypothetical protein CRJUMX01_1720003 [Escherichia coli]
MVVSVCRTDSVGCGICRVAGADRGHFQIMEMYQKGKIKTLREVYRSRAFAEERG